MITIIKHGDKKKAICPECSCEFFYEEEDIQRGDQRDWYMVVDCPDCHHPIDLTKKSLERNFKGFNIPVKLSPCRSCGQDPASCCGCDEYRKWQEKTK